MAYNFTANITLPNGARLELADLVEQRSVRNDPATVFEVHVELELRGGQAGGAAADYPLMEFGTYRLVVRDGVSDLLRKRTAAEWVSKSPASEILVKIPNGVATASGMTTLLAAWRGGTTSARLNAALTALKNIGVIDQTSLAGSAP